MTLAPRYGRAGWRRGVGLTEMLFIGATLVLILHLVGATAPIVRKVYENRGADSQTQRHGEAAIQRIARDIRFARGVLTADTTLVDLEMPAVDAKRQVILPMSKGKTVRYYLGKDNGIADANGTYLWRKEPASGDAKTKIALVAPGGIEFRYFPSSSDVESITVSVTSSLAANGETDIKKAREKGNYVSDFESSQEVLLRNKIEVN
jgi:hypothetical protein